MLDVVGSTVTVVGPVVVAFMVAVTWTAWYVIPLAPTVVVVMSTLPPPSLAWTHVAAFMSVKAQRKVAALLGVLACRV